MGIRGISFINFKENNNQITSFLNQFRENIFQLGGFGFDNWHLQVTNITSPKSEKSIRLITFSDTNDIISINENVIVAADSTFLDVLNDLGYSREQYLYKIEGALAYLGDFVVRYGTFYDKDKQIGVVIEVEYLPIVYITSEFQYLFNSFMKLLTQENLKYYYPTEENGKEFSLKSIGKIYSVFFNDIINNL